MLAYLILSCYHFLMRYWNSSSYSQIISIDRNYIQFAFVELNQCVYWPFHWNQPSISTTNWLLTFYPFHIHQSVGSVRDQTTQCFSFLLNIIGNSMTYKTMIILTHFLREWINIRDSKKGLLLTTISRLSRLKSCWLRK